MFYLFVMNFAFVNIIKFTICNDMTSMLSIFYKNMNLSLSSKAKVNIITRSPITHANDPSITILGIYLMIDDLC